MPKPNMWILKIGGSLCERPELSAWLDVAVALSKTQDIVIVPGGGLFANQIRGLQRVWQLDNAAAHDLAIHAMAQFGRLILHLNPALRAVRDGEVYRRGESQGTARVWLPQTSENVLPKAVRSWNVTSDSISLWLAQELHAEQLVLIKSVPPPSGDDFRATTLAKIGYIDGYFPELLAQKQMRCCFVVAAKHHHFLYDHSECFEGNVIVA